jgi:DNA-binding protein Fis
MTFIDLAELEKGHVKYVLRAVNGKKTKAARLLGISR